MERVSESYFSLLLSSLSPSCLVKVRSHRDIGAMVGKRTTKTRMDDFFLRILFFHRHREGKAGWVGWRNNVWISDFFSSFRLFENSFLSNDNSSFPSSFLPLSTTRLPENNPPPGFTAGSQKRRERQKKKNPFFFRARLGRNFCRNNETWNMGKLSRCTFLAHNGRGREGKFQSRNSTQFPEFPLLFARRPSLKFFFLP